MTAILTSFLSFIYYDCVSVVCLCVFISFVYDINILTLGYYHIGAFFKFFFSNSVFTWIYFVSFVAPYPK